MVQGHIRQLLFEIGLTQTQKSYLVHGDGVRAILFVVVQYGFQ